MKFNRIVLILNLILAFPIFSGEREGGGGIIIAAEFATAGRKAIQILGRGDLTLNLYSIFENIQGTKVVPVDKICYQEPVLGKEYCEDAHYDRTNNIVLLNFKNWDNMPCLDKLVLSTHEFLRAANLEGEDYTYSSRFMDRSIVQCTSVTPAEKSKCTDLTITLSRQVDVLCENLESVATKRKQESPIKETP